MVINTNLQAINANRQYNIVTESKKKTTEKLSSGYRINRAADDAAGLAISEKMRRQIKGLTQASRNAQDGISLVQVADGAMAEIHDMLHRANELSVKASNATLSDTDRGYIQAEIEQILQEIDDVHEKATFNEIPVLRGGEEQAVQTTGGGVNVGTLPAWVSSPSLNDGYKSETYHDSVSGNDYAAATFDFSALNASNVGELDGTGFNGTCATCDRHYSIAFSNDKATGDMEPSGFNYIYYVNLTGVTSGDELVNRIVTATGGHPQNHYDHYLADPSDAKKLLIYDDRTSITNSLGSRKSAVVEKGITYDADDVPNTPLQDELQLQVGAEKGQLLTVKLPNMSLGVLGIKNLNVSTIENAQTSIGSIKGALAKVSRERSNMGAYQNRLEHTIKNLDNVVENTTAAESSIRDTDMAKTMVDYANAGILEQAGTSILSQANQHNQLILSLLG